MAMMQPLQAALRFGCPCERGGEVSPETGMCAECEADGRAWAAFSRGEMTLAAFSATFTHDN
jgi:hypothetical protein